MKQKKSKQAYISSSSLCGVVEGSTQTMSDDERHTTRNTVKFREGTEPKNGISIICQGADRFYDDWSLPFFLARKLKSRGDRRARVAKTFLKNLLDG